MAVIAMLLSNPFRPDPRVLKEATSLAAAGHQVTVICWDRQAELPSEENLESGVRIERIQRVSSDYGIGARQMLRLPAFWRAAQPYLERLKPDIVHCHDFDALPAGLWWGWRRRVPVVYDAHEHYADLVKPRLRGIAGKTLYKLIRQLELRGARQASAVVTVDETLGDIYRRINRRVLVIGHYPAKNLTTKPASIFSRDEINLLYIGRLSADRGVLTYVEVLRSLLGSGYNARLHLAGVFTPASEKSEFDQRAAGLSKHIIMYGWMPYDAVPALLQSVDIGLAILHPEPRYVAALPVKLFEYMAAGLPLLASDFPPIARVVRDADCGILVDPLSDPGEIAGRIMELWRDKPRARSMGMRGRQAVLDQYNWEALASHLNMLYKELIDQFPQP